MNIFKAIQRVVSNWDEFDVCVFVFFLVVVPPLALIWFAVRVFQELE